MSYFDESDARRDARRDHDRGRCDREMYDRHSFDARKEAYTEEWNAAKREEEFNLFGQLVTSGILRKILRDGAGDGDE